MIPVLEPMLSELREEAVITRRVLDRVPADKLSWRPHPKSMSLGQLALHVASIPGSLARLTQLDEFDVSKASFNPAARYMKCKLAERHRFRMRPPGQFIRRNAVKDSPCDDGFFPKLAKHWFKHWNHFCIS